MIDKIGNVNKVVPSNKAGNTNKKAPTPSAGDSVSISAEAQKAAEIQTHVTRVKEHQDPQRAEKIREVKLKLKNGDYDNLSAETLSSIADRIAPTLLQS